MDIQLPPSLQHASLPMQITKRDGRQVRFELNKVITAIKKAIVATYGGGHDDIADRALDRFIVLLQSHDCFTVEACQDLVEQALMECNEYAVAKNYILYRDQRNRVRQRKQDINQVIDSLVNVEAEDSDEARENANVNANSTMGGLLKVGEASLKDYATLNLFSSKYLQLYKDGIIHIHDLALGCLTINCLFIPLAKLLRHGFSTGHGFLRPPSNIGSAATLTCIVIQSSQNDMLKHH